MQIQHKEEAERGRFFIAGDGERLAELDYSKASGVITIYHTRVDERLKGKNIGNQLVEKAVEFARSHELKIGATCPFAKTVLEKKPGEYADVLSTI